MDHIKIMCSMTMGLVMFTLTA